MVFSAKYGRTQRCALAAGAPGLPRHPLAVVVLPAPLGGRRPRGSRARRGRAEGAGGAPRPGKSFN